MNSNLDFLPNQAEVTMTILEFQTAMMLAANNQQEAMIELLEGELRFYSGDELKGFKRALDVIKG